MVEKIKMDGDRPLLILRIKTIFSIDFDTIELLFFPHEKLPI